jgi:glycosidase
MLYFLENHDEQRIASDFFAGNGMRGVPGMVVSVLLQQNPFMLYAGQEFGERGMDSEGFSGKDGRTTIFDYWSVESIRRGYFDRRAMSSDEKQLEAIYKYVLNLANAEKAFAEGDFFDLMYMNHHIAAKQYAFLRKAGNEFMLVVANFSDSPACCDVVIPQHAIDFMQIPEKEYSAVDLLSNEPLQTAIHGDQPVSVSVAPYAARIYKFVI